MSVSTRQILGSNGSSRPAFQKIIVSLQYQKRAPISGSPLFIRIYDYSMIVATRPDPTVRPPSRYQTGVLRCANGAFSCDLWGKIRIFCFVRVVFGVFVIMVLSQLVHSSF